MAKDKVAKEKVIKSKSKGSVGKMADGAKISLIKANDFALETKKKIQENTSETDDVSPERFATDKVTESMQRTAEDVLVTSGKAVKQGARKVSENIKQKRSERLNKNVSDDCAEVETPLIEEQIDSKGNSEANPKSSLKKSQSDTSQKSKKKLDEKKKSKPKQRKQTPPKTRGELSVKKPKAEQQPIKYTNQADSKIKQTARSSANTIKSVKTAEKTAKNAKRAEQAAKSAKKAEVATKKAAEKTAQTVKAVGEAIIEAAKATATATKEIGSIIAAGGVPAVVLIVIICLIAAIGGTCFGIFLSNDDTTGSKMTMTQAMSQLTTDYYNDLEDFKSNYRYDQYEINTGSGNITIDWKTVLAVYAVKTTTSTDEAYEVATLDDNKYELLKTVLYDMNPKSGQVTQKSVPIISVTTDENGESIKKTTYVTKKVLTITIGHLSAQEICDYYSFNGEQKAMLDELLSEEYNDLWNEIIHSSGSIILPGDTQVGTGGFVWPIAGSYTITSRFGTRVDPISGVTKTHGGTDVAAAQGTPIVAAADGTVVISSYMAGGYGYYVKIQHDGTYSTLYGHCSALLVSAGQTVKQGQVIAKVGSTGYSTGPHCHFEMIKNGVRVDALGYY